MTLLAEAIEARHGGFLGAALSKMPVPDDTGRKA
jgi:hypothetical protein